MTKDRFDIEVDLSANDPINIDLEVCITDAVSDAYIIERIERRTRVKMRTQTMKSRLSF